MSVDGVLPDQEALRRRLRAARALHDLTLEMLAQRIPPAHKLGARTLRRLENGEALITERHIPPIAQALGMPDDWFTTTDPVWAAFEAKSTTGIPTDCQREFDAIYARLHELEARLAALPPSEGGEAAAHRPAVPRPPQRSHAETRR